MAKPDVFKSLYIKITTVHKQYNHKIKPLT